MKYLLQQMIAFVVIILTVLIIFGVSFRSYTRRTVTETSYAQLKGYSDTIIDNIKQQNWTLQQSLDTSQSVLKKQKVAFTMLNPDLTVSYPVEFEGQSGSSYVTETELDSLKNGNTIKKTVKDTHLSTNSQPTSLFIQPLFSSPDLKFMGLLLVSRPDSSIDASLKSLTNDLLKGFLISTIIAIWLSYFLAKFQVKRIDRMKQATNQLANGNYDVQIKVKDKGDELDELASDFNLLAIALKESQEEIERQEERRRNFMADVAHEMRTPLTTINGLLEGISYGAIPKDQEEKCITLMQNETRRLIRLVNENLDYEKIRTNQIKMVIQQFNATEVLELIIEQLKGKAGDKNDQLILDTTEPIKVCADYDRFVQVVVNITTNAIQFTQDGEIRLSLSRLENATVVSISDNGIGMDKEQQKNMWDRYYKADPSRKNTKYGESGLGLSIVDQLVKLHKGSIQVISELGVGTTFKVTFPDHEIKK
ncbi:MULTISPECIES: sensor histidine kinase [Enterococcaceae]|uniref:sensor histidine kinase n=1 Tax=Enterococcaceae TaxID=81852 RepID=UPI000E54E4D5|nr:MULTISPECIES: sensor histidine kinase [Enterococcaceae]MCI0129758.1 ATP-binding protein [Vagococcus sp. CY53-2]RGI31934.1 HAMP domain-containing protein [Melissococcus sp. OM08-11BH]UNM90400.1 ATP-binding protein [Vagococcus sp. CY52-2]